MGSKWDLIVIGAGASGLACAIAAAACGERVLLLEAQEQMGKKILASGNGRCNILNSGEPRYYGNPDFAKAVLDRMGHVRISAFLHRYGLFLSEENHRLYPCTFQSKTVMMMFRKALEIEGVTVHCSESVLSVRKRQEGFEIRTTKTAYQAERAVLAAGGMAGAALGGTFDGYRLARELGFQVTPIRPALSPLLTDSRSVSGLSGIRARCRVTLFHENRKLHEEEGEVLFTENGVSGICAMQMARFLEGPDDRLDIHFLHRFFSTMNEAETEMAERKCFFASQSPEYLLAGLVNSKIAYAICKQAGLAMKGETIQALTGEQIRKVFYTAMHYQVHIRGTRGFDNAQVTAGGVEPDAFSPDNLESLRIRGFHMTGELLDVDGDCGGFNLMFALATGLLAGLNGRSSHWG